MATRFVVECSSNLFSIDVPVLHDRKGLSSPRPGIGEEHEGNGNRPQMSTCRRDPLLDADQEVALSEQSGLGVAELRRGFIASVA